MPRFLTKEEVSAHDKASDCWIIIKGNVYDVTRFIRAHPGGIQSILVHAGDDCTEEFLALHGESYLETFHGIELVGSLKGASPPPKALAEAGISGSGTPLSSESVLSLPRTVYGPQHEAYRMRFRDFLSREVVPQYANFERDGHMPKSVYARAAAEGFYCPNIPREFGGRGQTDWRYNAILCEELENSDVGGFFLNLQNDMVVSYFNQQANADQQRRWLPRIAKGAVIAVAMSEPEVGSDLGALSTRAERVPGGFKINGRKMWISAGQVCELVVIAAVTDPSKGSRGISLFVVESERKGFSCAKRVKKLGKDASDTCLLTLQDCVVPEANLVGGVGNGFKCLMKNLAKERLSIAVGSVASARRVLALTTNYVKGRKAFGGRIGGLQSVQTRLARCRVAVETATAFVDRCILEQAQHRLSAETAAVAKYIGTETGFSVATQCLQLYGGYGYVRANPVARHFADQRVTRIYGGANEVMLEIIAKGLGLKPQRFRRPRSRL